MTIRSSMRGRPPGNTFARGPTVPLLVEDRFLRYAISAKICPHEVPGTSSRGVNTPNARPGSFLN